MKGRKLTICVSPNMIFPCLTSVSYIAVCAQFTFGNQIKSSLVAPPHLVKIFLHIYRRTSFAFAGEVMKLFNIS